MGDFAIVRDTGDVDKVTGETVADVSHRFGWPGNGTIEVWDDTIHLTNLSRTLADPAEQNAPAEPSHNGDD